MKLNKIVILLLLLTSSLCAQDFEGTMIYEADFEVSEKILNLGMTKEMLKSKMVSEGSWADTIKKSYKNGYYHQLNLSTDNSWIIYRPDSNFLYTFQSGETSDICYIQDASVDLEERMIGKLPLIRLHDTLVKYESFNLKMIEVQWKTGSYFYFFDDNYFKVNPDKFKGHIHDGFYEFLRLSGSLPIMIIKEAKGTMTTTILLVNSMNHIIDESLFQIPELIEDEGLNSYNTESGRMMKIKR